MKRIVNYILIFTLTICLSCEKEESTPSENEEAIEFNIGDSHQGGIIFYLDETGEHGLIAFTEDLGKAPWGCYYNDAPEFLPPFTPIAQNTEIGSGLENTLAILGFCDDENIAAKLCYDFTANVYDDWYLPSIDELALIYENRELIGGFPDLNNTESYIIYASSSEAPGVPYDNEGTIFYGRSFVYDFSVNTIIENTRELLSTKDNDFLIRPIRSF